MQRYRHSFSLALLMLLIAPGPSGAEEQFTPPAVKDQDAAIQAQMRDRWKSPQRQLWRIQYHPIKGSEGRSAWHIAGTHWWVRVHPDWIKLDDFDKTAVYELDAVALDQNYGVIDFYVYHRQQVAK